MLTRSSFTVALVLGLCGTVTPAFAEPPAAAPAAPAMQQPEAPKGIPVPSDLPVIKKTEIEGGLILEDLKIGEGYEVKEHGAVVAHYHGTLKDGTVFDSSFQRGEPVGFPLDGVIPGWQKGVPGMKIGGIRRLTIPYAMAYGEAGRPPTIPAKSDLIFIIELKDAVQIEEQKVGDGEELGQRAIVIAATTCKTADGKEVESYTAAKPYIWLPGELQGLDYGLAGMKVGGKRKITVPAQMNPAVPGLETKRPSGVPLVIELEILNVRNLVPPQPKK